MERVKVAVYLALIIAGTIFAAVFNKPDKALALAPIDQNCQYGMTPPQYAWMSHQPIQAFVPVKGMLDAVGVYVRAEIGASVPMKLEVVSENAGGAVIAESTQIIPNEATWVTFDLTDVATPLGLYAIQLSDADPAKKSIWFQGPGSCYDRGFAIWGNTAHEEVDFRFATYGYDPESPSNPEPSAGDQSNTDNNSAGTSGGVNIGTSRGTGSAPANSTSTAIAAPTNLIATNESNYSGTGIRLNWTAGNTSGVDGYKIFRSSSASGGFIEIGRVISGITIYIDTTVTVGQTFYYVVRAYKGNLESASSNVASATAKDTFKEEILKDHQANSGGGVFGGLLFFLARVAIPLIIFGLIFILFIVGIILLIRRRRKNNQTESQPQNPPADQKTGKK